jgi:hypothetical protein
MVVVSHVTILRHTKDNGHAIVLSYLDKDAGQRLTGGSGEAPAANVAAGCAGNEER